MNSTSTLSFYSNPLIVLAYAHRTTINVNSSIAVSGTTQAESASVTLPVTLLLLIPAIGLMVGGYLAASTNYSGRRLFSITRGASIGILYALLILLISLVTSTTFSISLGGATSESLSYSPDAISALLSGLLCGVVFGALGGALQSRSISPATPARPVYRGSARIRAALIGAVGALGTYFVLCLVLVVALYAVAQLGGPAPHTEGSLSLTGSTNNPCHVFLQQPAPSAQPAIKNDFPTHLSFAIISPTLALWVMTVSMGAPLQLSILGFAFNFGFFNADCQPGPEGILLYLFLLLPAVSVFGGGWMAARSAQPRSTREAAGIGLLLAPAIAILFLILSLLASISESVSLGGLGTGSTTISFGPAISSTLLASLLFGGIFGILGSIAGRPRHLPPLQPAVAPAWPATPGAWPPAAQPPAQPIISSAVASFRPAPFEPAPGSPGGQPSGEPTSPEPPDAMLPSEVPSET